MAAAPSPIPPTPTQPGGGGSGSKKQGMVEVVQAPPKRSGGFFSFLGC